MPRRLTKPQKLMKSLAKRWKSLSKKTKRKYEGRFSDYYKAKAESRLSAKSRRRKR